MGADFKPVSQPFAGKPGCTIQGYHAFWFKKPDRTTNPSMKKEILFIQDFPKTNVGKNAKKIPCLVADTGTHTAVAMCG